MQLMRCSWDIFCSVVDNFGDIGVCWRLARRLSAGLGHDVRLWVDDLASFKRLRPEVDVAAATQKIGLIEVRHWTAVFPDVVPAQIVVEGFGVRLPDRYVEAMAAMRPVPVWINLEYLSAESWVDEHHGLPSPHPRLPLTKYFFFPGFTKSTGGVLIEDGLLDARNAFQSDAASIARFRQSIGLEGAGGDEMWISLFCYENAALPGLVAAWAKGVRGIQCIVPEGCALSQLEKIGGKRIPVGAQGTIGGLTVHAIPFLDLDQYDRLLWSCDLNFVRGEESFVRAQLAARPLVWQAYLQDADAHLDKASAFWRRYAGALDGADGDAYSNLFHRWNRQSADAGEMWPAMAGHMALYAANATRWAGILAENGDLADNLAKFCGDRLK